MSYLVGQDVRIPVTFQDLSGTLIDPISLTLTLQLPDNSQLTYHIGDVAHEATGKYHLDYQVLQAGEYLYRWDGEGAVSDITEGSFAVNPSALVPQPIAPIIPPDFTQANLNAINAAIASGVNRVRFDTGREVTYASMQDLIIARDLILNYLGQMAIPERRQLRIYTGSGW